MSGIRRFFTNVVCGFISDKERRKKTRVLLNSPMRRHMKFIRRDMGTEKIVKVKTFIGYQARNLLIAVNDKYVYKFPLRRDNSNELALKEKRVVDALRPRSPIPIPAVEILYNRRAQIIRKYEFVRGKTMRQLPAADVLAHKEKIARAVAKFIHFVASADPVEIRDLKPRPNAKPGFMRGWSQGDICDNFMIDEKTFDVICFFDWEDCFFGNFSQTLRGERRSPNKEIQTAIRHAYENIYNGDNK